LTASRELDVIERYDDARSSSTYAEGMSSKEIGELYGAKR